MTQYSTGIVLQDLLTDTTPTGVLLPYRINGTAYPSAGSWPITVSLDFGEAVIPLEGNVLFDDLADTTGLPAAGQTKTMGTFTWTGWDGSLESATYTFTVDATGANTATAPAAFTVSTVTVTTEASTNGDRIGINPTTIPSDGGDAINAIKYQVDSGSGFGTEQTLTGLGTGKRLVSVLAETSAIVRIWCENTVGSATTYDAPAVTPTKSGGADPTANTTAATATALNTLMDSLESDYDTTVAANGGTAGQPFYIDCTSGDYSSAIFSNRQFDHTVHVRAADAAGGCTGSTSNSFANSVNLWLEYFTATGSGSTDVWKVTGSADNVVFRRCEGIGHPTPGSWSTKSAFLFGQTSGSRVRGCGAIECFGSQGTDVFKYLHGDDIVCEGNVVENSGNDDFKFRGNIGGAVRDNWSSTVMLGTADTIHGDFLQFWSPSGSADENQDLDIHGNIGALWNDIEPAEKPYRQTCMLTTDPQVNLEIHDNIFVSCNTNGIQCNGSTGTNVYNNTVLFLQGETGHPGGSTTHTRISGGGTGSTFTDNVERASVSQAKAGSTLITIAEYNTKLSGDIGVGDDAADLEPQVGSGLHWNDASPVGAYNRLEEVFSTGLHPGNVGWPIKDPWDAGHNQTASIAAH